MQFLQLQQKQIEMQTKLPSPEQIYDFSTDQLSKLKNQLENKVQNLNNCHNQRKKQLNDEEIQKINQLLQNIDLEIQQRKTIQFFTQLCINDGTANKYVKQITDFNNQFKKLANQLLQNKSEYQKESSIAEKRNNNEINSEKFSMQLEKQNELDRNRRISHTSITSANTTKSTLDKENKSNTLQTQNSEFSQTQSSEIKAGRETSTKKMGLGVGSMKKKKSTMQDFIKATLNKTKAVQYVSGKGGIVKKQHQKVPNSSSRVSTSQQNINTTPISTSKSIKPSTQESQYSSRKEQSKKDVYSSNKNVSSKSEKSINGNRQSLMKKRNEAIQKMKTMKKPQNSSSNTQNHPPIPQKKKAPKGLDPKSLVQMVKQEQDAKKKRQSQVPSTKQQKIKRQEENKIQTMQKQKQSILSEKVNQKNLQEKSHAYQNDKQFPIKEEINPILSSSDTESQGQGLGITKKQKIQKSKRTNKQQAYTPIPQEQIQQSIVYQNVKNDTQKNQKQQNIFNKDSQKDEEIKVKQQKKQKCQIQNQTKAIVHNHFQKKQQKEFGKIIVQDYNPNGYQDQEQGPIQRQKTQQNQNQESQQQPKQSQNEKIQIINKNQTLKNLYQPKKETKKITEKTKSSQKQSKKSLKKNQQQYDALIKLPAVQDIQKKCYNEQYWLHIKQEAQAKIQRFKQQKELQRKQRQLKDKLLQDEKKKIKSKVITPNIQDSQKSKENEKQNQSTQISVDQVTQNSIALAEDINDKFIEQQKQNLKKIYEKNNINGSKKVPKKTVSTIVKQPTPSYPKPQFNYLQIFPTFNHIFNVFHTKPQNQALLDIPLVMRQIIMMFEDHLAYLKNHTNNFRPAIFLPFDNRKANRFSDARQLLQHAETTHVNLKQMIQKLDVFNANIQGEFENCTNEQKANTQYYRVVKSKQQVYDIITTSFLRIKGWKQLPHGQNLKANWNLFWSWSKPEIDMNKLLTFQKVNHFPFNKNLSRKDLLYKNIEFFRKTHKVAFPYLPLTFNLPKQFTQFSKRFHQQQLINRDKNYWIMKPIGKSRGRGIKLINSLGDLNYLDNIVVQKYIANPLLIDGYKFDMRIYVLVTSFHPLQAFVYREGFARLSTEKYSLQPGAMKNNFVHLTNFSINKHNLEGTQQFSGGSKISLKTLRQKVTKMGYSFTSVWSQVHQIVIKSLLACSVSVPPFPGAFELFGYDVMLDQQGQCHLIEINASPSLQRSFLIDQIIKQSLIDDIIQIVNPPNFSKEQVIKVMNERLSPDFRNNKKGVPKNLTNQEEDLIHLARILKYQKLRKYGEMPQKIGLFQMVAPSQMSKQLQKLIKSKSGINNPHNID